jgi:hypothetical protein
MPLFVSVLAISASVKSSYRFVASSVKITNGAGDWLISFALLSREESTHSAMRTVFRLIQRPHPQCANMTSPVIARRNGIVDNRRRTNEAHFCFDFPLTFFLVSLLSSRLQLLLR